MDVKVHFENILLIQLQCQFREIYYILFNNKKNKQKVKHNICCRIFQNNRL